MSNVGKIIRLDDLLLPSSYIWQHKDPTAMTWAIVRILHENAAVKEAAKELDGA